MGVDFLGIKADMFFDKPGVVARVNDARRRAMNLIGGFIRKSARRNIRRRKRYSRPGQGPTNQTGVLRDGILYGYDGAAGSVVIGPTVAAGRRNEGVIGAPELLEYGGRVFRKHSSAGPEDEPVDMLYEPRPYMGPALDAARESTAIDDAWKDTIG